MQIAKRKMQNVPVFRTAKNIRIENHCVLWNFEFVGKAMEFQKISKDMSGAEVVIILQF